MADKTIVAFRVKPDGDVQFKVRRKYCRCHQSADCRDEQWIDADAR